MTAYLNKPDLTCQLRKLKINLNFTTESYSSGTDGIKNMISSYDS